LFRVFRLGRREPAPEAALSTATGTGKEESEEEEQPDEASREPGTLGGEERDFSP
jgi:hypothetical protein